MKKYTFIILIFLLLVAFQSCHWMAYEPSKLVINSEYIQLEWDPPPVNEEYDFLPVVSYKIYYRIHGMNDWILLDLIPADQNPKYTVYHSDLGNGSYDFAISAVQISDSESQLHSSLDTSADPVGGWYIIWLRFE